MTTLKTYRPELLDSVPPNSEADEMAVLSAVFLDNRVFDEMATALKPEEFYREDHAAIYRAFLELHQKQNPINILSVLELVERGGVELDHSHLADVVHHAAYAASWRYHAGIVRERAAKRACIHAAQLLLATAYDPAIESTEWRLQADTVLIDQAEKNITQTKNATDVMTELSEAIDESTSGRATLSWGFAEIDQSVGYMVAGENIIIAARPSMGKSALALNIAEHAAKTGRAVLFFSLEMPAKDLAARSVCGDMGVDGLRLRNNLLCDAERKLLAEGMARFSQLPIFICDRPSMSITDILHEAMRVKRKHGMNLLIVDYLGLIVGDAANVKLYEQTSKISKGIKRIAREVGVPMLTLCQLNRKGDDTTRPTLRELRDSGAIEEDADRVAFVVRAEIRKDEKGKRKYYGIGEKDDPNAMLLVDKNRNGPVANIRLTWNPKAIRFESLYHPANREMAFDSYGGSSDGF